MSKQLVMENYVDECLDEVEIRGIFITEGIMDTPILSMIKKLTKRLSYADTEITTLKSRIDHWTNVLVDLKKDQHLIHNASKKINSARISRNYRTNELKQAIDHKKYLLSLINKTKSNPDMLGNTPYLYQIMGATAIVAAVAYASYRIYKRFMSKAAKACQDKKGKSKSICMNQYQIKGLESSKKPLTDGIKNCSKAKDTQICKAKFNKKINAINKRITKKQNQIKKLASK